jgi:proteasome accessory factor C
MPEPAESQLNRIVQLVADLSKAARDGGSPPTLDALGDRYGTKRSVILQDLRILTEAGSHSSETWLSSLTVEQVGDRVSVQSQGPYRRPIKLTLDEFVALQAAVATELDEPAPLLAKLRPLAGAARDPANLIHAIPDAPAGQATAVARAEQAMRERRVLRLVYLGAGADEPTDRTVEVHDVVSAIGRHYIVAWCRLAEDWRRFRADRVLEVEVGDEAYQWRPDAPLTLIEDRADLFEPPDSGTDDVRVRFSPRIARWIAERYPQGDAQADGSVVVTFTVASVDWLVRHVLQYGGEAEVLEPRAYRGAIRRAVGR